MARQNWKFTTELGAVRKEFQFSKLCVVQTAYYFFIKQVNEVDQPYAGDISER